MLRDVTCDPGWFDKAHALPIFPFYTITAPFSPEEVLHFACVCVARINIVRFKVLRISLAWGDRFAADARIKCPLKAPFRVPS